MESTNISNQPSECIAFVVKRYGDQINGGGELHCRMLAEKLILYYNVEILTTCVNDYRAYTNEFDEGESNLNGVLVRRFKADGFSASADKGAIRLLRKLRRTLFRLGLLRHFARFTQTDKGQETYLQSLKFNSLGLLEYLKSNKHRYKKIFFLTYNSPLTIRGVELCGKQSILIPTAHYESELFLPFLYKLFTLPSFIAFNSKAERSMCERIFPNMPANDVVGVGILPKVDFTTASAVQKPLDRYIVYIGRVDEGKLGTLVPDFIRFVKETNEKCQLIIIGGIFAKTVDHPNITYTGFIDETRKQHLLKSAKMLVNPSAHESLSLVVLEAFSLGIPVLVNGKCEVLKDHVRISKAGMAYSNYRQFKTKLLTMLHSSESTNKMSVDGISYFQNNYQWDVVLEKLKKAIAR